MAPKGNPVKYAVAAALRAARRVVEDLLDGIIEDVLIVVFSLSNIVTGLIESLWAILVLTVTGILLCLWRYNFILSVQNLSANFAGIAATLNIAIIYLNWVVRDNWCGEPHGPSPDRQLHYHPNPPSSFHYTP